MGINHEQYMREAIEQALLAKAKGEVPVGAIAVVDDTIIARGFNQPISTCDPSAHAEMVVLREAAQQLQNYRLNQVTLYVTLEPCLMCTGLLLHARLKEVVFGAYDPKVGAISDYNMLEKPNLNHHVTCVGGVLEQACSDLLVDFFKTKR